MAHFSAYAKKDTTYYNQGWSVCKAVDAAYYRTWESANGGFTIADYYIDGTLMLTGSMRSNNEKEFWDYRTGHFAYYHPLKYIMCEGDFKNGKREGKWSYYMPGSDTLLMDVIFKNDLTCKNIFYGGPNAKSGIETEIEYHLEIKKEVKNDPLTVTLQNDSIYTEIVTDYYENGKIKSKTIDEDNKAKAMLSENCFGINGKDTACAEHEKHSLFRDFFTKKDYTKPEAPYSIAAYLGQNIHYPDYAIEKSIEGRVMIEFIVLEDGTIAGAIVNRSVSSYLNEEALRVVAKMPKWKPATNHGKRVKVYFRQPVKFKLE